MGVIEINNLVRQKILEEREGKTSGPTATKYNQAMKDYPALMWLAHYNLAKEWAK